MSSSLGPESFKRLHSRWQLGCNHLEARVGERPTAKLAQTAVGRFQSFVTSIPLQSSHVMAAWPPQEQVLKERAQNPLKCYSLISEMTYHHFCHAPVIMNTNSDTTSEESTQGMKTRQYGSWRVILEGGYTSCQENHRKYFSQSFWYMTFQPEKVH